MSWPRVFFEGYSGPIHVNMSKKYHRYMKHFIVFMVLQARPTYACKFLLTEKTTVQDEMLLEFWKLKPKAK